MCLRGCWEAIKKSIGEGLSGLPWDLVKLVGLAIIVFLLGSTMAGNWIRCNFFDANGCLPKLVAEVNSTAIAIEAVRKLEAVYHKIDDYPTNENAFEYIRYDITFNNKGRDHVETMTVKVIPSLDPTNPGRVLLYGLDTGLDRKANKRIGNDYEFSTLNFDLINSFTVTEMSKVFFVIAFDKELYRRRQGTMATFLIQCEFCQERLTKLEAGGG